MRTVFSALVVGLACLADFQPGLAEDKEEGKRRERLEKQLAALEPTLEKEEWAVERKQFIAEWTKHLSKAEHIELFRVNPRELPEGSKKKAFHGHEVLSEIRIEAKRGKQAAAFLGKTLHWNEFRKALCFNPRHGLRAIAGKRTLDFLICFECNRVRVFEGGKQLAELPMGFTEQKNPIEQFLADNEKKSRERK